MEAMNGSVRPLNPDEQAWLRNILGDQSAVQAPEMIENSLQIAPAAEDALTPFSVINILQQFGQQLNALAEQSDKEDSEFAAGKEIIANLQISANQLCERAHFAEKNVIATLEANCQLNERLAEQGQQMFATLQQLNATQEAHLNLVSKVAQNEARSMSKQIEKQVALLQSLVHKYLNHPLRQENPSVIADEELQNILQLTQQLHVAIQEMQPHIEDQHLNPENANYLKGVIERSKQQLQIAEEKINELAALVSLDAKHDARDLVDNALVAHDALRERKAAILLLAEQRHEPCLLSVQELQLIDRLLANLESAAEKLAPAFEEAPLSLADTQMLWNDQEQTEALLQQTMQKTQQLQNQLSYAVKSHGQKNAMLIDGKLNGIRELMERLRRPLLQSGDILATPEELAAMQEKFEGLEDIKNRLLPALNPAALLREETDALSLIIQEAEAKLLAIEPSITILKNKVSNDVKQAAQAILGYAPQRLESVCALKNTYVEILARDNQPGFVEQEPTLENLKQSLEAKLVRMNELATAVQLPPEKEIELIGLVAETRGNLHSIEVKNTKLAAHALHSLAEENRKLILQAEPKLAKIRDLFSKHLAHAQRLLRTPSISEERQAGINSLKEKLERNLQGSVGDLNQALPADLVARSNLVNLNTIQNIAAAIIELEYLEGIISNHTSDVKETAETVITLGNSKITKLSSIIEKYEDFTGRYGISITEEGNRLNIENVKNYKNQLVALIGEMQTMRALQHPYNWRTLTAAQVERLRVLIVEVRAKIAAIDFMPQVRRSFNIIKEASEYWKQRKLATIRDEPSNAKARVPDSTYLEAPDSEFTYNAIYNTVYRTRCENYEAYYNLVPVVGSLVFFLYSNPNAVARKNSEAKFFQNRLINNIKAVQEIPLLLESIAND